MYASIWHSCVRPESFHSFIPSYALYTLAALAPPSVNTCYPHTHLRAHTTNYAHNGSCSTNHMYMLQLTKRLTFDIVLTNTKCCSCHLFLFARRSFDLHSTWVQVYAFVSVVRVSACTRSLYPHLNSPHHTTHSDLRFCRRLIWNVSHIFYT